MSINLVGNVDVQYFLFAFTPQKKTLQGDRRKKEDPQLDLLIDEEDQSLIFYFYNLQQEKLRERPTLHVDIYILVEEAHLLVNLLESIKDNIIGATDLDRQIRTVRDPQFTYDDSKVPLRIDKTTGNFKATSISAGFAQNNTVVIWTRDKETDQDPYVHVDLEHTKTRLHFGIGSQPDDIISNNIKANEFEIVVPFSEFGQLYYSVKDAINL